MCDMTICAYTRLIFQSVVIGTTVCVSTIIIMFGTSFHASIMQLTRKTGRNNLITSRECLHNSLERSDRDVSETSRTFEKKYSLVKL